MTTDGHTVVVILPADADFLRLARMNAMGMASSSALSVDELDDLRLAVDELCHLLINGPGDDLCLELRSDAGAVVVSGSRSGTEPGDIEIDPIVRTILDTTTTQWTIEAGPERRFTLRKAPANT